MDNFNSFLKNKYDLEFVELKEILHWTKNKQEDGSTEHVVHFSSVKIGNDLDQFKLKVSQLVKFDELSKV
jgi:hypothetical protein